ncbi:MAG: MurR/RpiR family transcriptional regulator [Oscillospiraceae bacterium]|nr:MurR/RpiR family transcriptional regulator [Oscillospiraceae bacterium]
MSDNLLGIIEEKLPEMSKGQRRIAEFITEHYDKAAFMTASKLGAITGVSESTVVRFAAELGFKGYPEMQKALKGYTSNRITSVQRMDVVADSLGGENILHHSMNFDIEQIRKTLEEIDSEDFDRTVAELAEARNVYVIGARSAAVLARFIVFYLNIMVPSCKIIHTTSTSEMFEQIINIGKGDIMIGVSFPRYSKHTVKAFRFAHENGAKVIAITDSRQSPLAKYADHLLLARSDMGSFSDSLVAPLSLINALITAVGMAKQDYVSHNLERLEEIWDKYEVFEKSDDQDY